MKTKSQFNFKRHESEIKKNIVDFLQILEIQGKVYFTRNNSFEGKIKRKNGSEGYIKNNKPGTPDFLICYSGKYIGFEVKTESGTQSDDQKKAQKAIERAGGIYYIVKNVNDVFNILK